MSTSSVARPTALRSLVQAPVFYALLGFLGAMSLAWNAVSVLLYPLLPARLGKAVGRAGIFAVYRTFWRVAEATGLLRLNADALETLRGQTRLIVAANHPSMLDAMLLASRLPKSCCVMKAELMRNVFLGAAARLARYITNDSLRGMLRLAADDLKEGNQLVVFPEGTRTVSPPLDAFRPGCTFVSKLAGAPIQTVFIRTESPYLSKHWPIWRLPPLPIVVSVELGARFQPSDDVQGGLAELERYFRAQLRARGR